MEILIAEDDPISKKILEKALSGWGHTVISTENGAKALEVLKENPKIRMLITDWMMPDLDGLELCKQIRQLKRDRYLYVILLTALASKDKVVEGIDAGADDYVTKPFDRSELRVRINAGKRLIVLEGELAKRVKELEHSLAHIKKLEGLLPICSHCKKIREDVPGGGDNGDWKAMEQYIGDRSDAQFTHSICPECMEKYYGK